MDVPRPLVLAREMTQDDKSEITIFAAAKPTPEGRIEVEIGELRASKASGTHAIRSTFWSIEQLERVLALAKGLQEKFQKIQANQE